MVICCGKCGAVKRLKCGCHNCAATVLVADAYFDPGWLKHFAG